MMSNVIQIKARTPMRRIGTVPEPVFVDYNLATKPGRKGLSFARPAVIEPRKPGFDGLVFLFRLGCALVFIVGIYRTAELAGQLGLRLALSWSGL